VLKNVNVTTYLRSVGGFRRGPGRPCPRSMPKVNLFPVYYITVPVLQLLAHYRITVVTANDCKTQ